MAAYAYFQIGENIIAKCAYYSYTESRLESIEGSGDMYESVDDFTVIGAVDDALIPAAAGMTGCGVAFMGKGRRCEICGEEYY